MLIVMAGLPGTGKSTIAGELGLRLRAAVIAVDPIDDALRRAGIEPDQPTGLAAYLAAETVADSLLAADLSVVIDAVNAAEPARQQWRELAARHGVSMAVVEVVCSDPAVHRARLAGRRRGLAGLPEPTWEDVGRRAAGYRPWTEPVLRLDSVDALDANVRAVLTMIASNRPVAPRPWP